MKDPSSRALAAANDTAADDRSTLISPLKPMKHPPTMPPLTSLDEQTVGETVDSTIGEVNRSKINQLRKQLTEGLELAATRVLKTAIAQGSIRQSDPALNVLSVVLEQLEKLQPKRQKKQQYQSNSDPIAEVNPVESEPVKLNRNRREVRGK